MIFDEDGLHRAGGRFLPCPFCKEGREWLKIRKAVRYDPVNREEQAYYSVHCEFCHMAFGEEEGEPIFESESDLLAKWNCRRY